MQPDVVKGIAKEVQLEVLGRDFAAFGWEVVDVFAADAGGVQLSAIDPDQVTLEHRSLHVGQCDLLLFALDPTLRAGGCEELGLGADDVFVDEERLLTRPNKH